MFLIVLLLGLIFPRLITLLLWLFTGWFRGVFQTTLVPLLGFLFMPYTLLWYSAVQNWFGGRWEFLTILVLIIAVLVDLGAIGKSRG